MFERFKEWYYNRHEYAKRWKEEKGGKIIGTFCTYVPEEIIYAAGALPVRVLGSHEPQDVSERYIFSMFCPFCRDVLAQGLKGRYSYLDGITIAQSCLHLRQAYTSWQNHVPVDFDYYIYMPMKVQTPHAVPYYASEISKYKDSLEQWMGKSITDSDIEEAIEIVNENRKLLHKLYEFRKMNPPLLTGTESMFVSVTSQFIDKREHSEELKKLLEKLPDRKPPVDEEKKRLMIIGSENDDIELLDMIESLNAVIVTDDHCTGTRYFYNTVEDHKDGLLHAISQRYIKRPPCPNKDWEVRTRFPHILKLYEDFGAEGVILLQQKFCDPHELDIPPLTAFLKERDIPVLFLELDVTVPKGQFRIRVEAFLEMMSQADLFDEDLF